MTKYKSIQTLSPAIHLEGWARHFGHKYIIKLSNKNLVPYQMNLMLNSNQELTLIRKTQTLSRHKHGFQQGFLSTRFPFSNLTELIFISCRFLIPNDWKQISISMRLLQNLLITDNARFFERFF